MLTLPQWEAWELIKDWHPTAVLDESRVLIQILGATIWGEPYHEFIADWLPAFGLAFLPMTQTVFTPGVSISLDCPELTQP